MKKLNNKFYEFGESLNLAVLSDLHFSDKYDYNIFLNITNNLLENKPDYICIIGDIVDRVEVLEIDTLRNRLKFFFEKLSLIAPVIFVTGNHDFTDTTGKTIYNDSFFMELDKIKNIHYLKNNSMSFGKINFVGLEVDPKHYVNEADNLVVLNAVKNINNHAIEDKYNVLLFHSPINMNEKDVLEAGVGDYDLVLCGHMHKGLMCGPLSKLNGNKGLVGPNKRFFPKNARGCITCENDKTKIVISSGIITFSNTAGLFRLFDKHFCSIIEYIKVL